MGQRCKAGMVELAAALAVVLLVVGCSSSGAGRRRASAPLRLVCGPAASGTWGHGAWSWFGDPRAVYVGGRYDEVVVGWIDWVGAVMVGTHDPRSCATRSYVLGRLPPDDHSAPSILVEPDERLTVFWSGHDGKTMYYRTTTHPADIRAWGPLRHVPRNVREGAYGYTYPNPVLLPAEADITYLFWRGANWSEDYAAWSLSGRWGPVHQLIRVRGQRPYVKVASNGRDEIAFAFTDGHPRNAVTSVYYAAYRAGALWTARGRYIARMGGGPIAPRRADLVYNGRRTGVRSWVWDVAFGADGRPVIVYATFPHGGRHKYWYARWTGTHWVSHFLTVGGRTISRRTFEVEYSAGLTLDHSNPSIVYLSRQVRGGYEIDRWTTPDGGVHWHQAVVVAADGSQNVRPIVPRGWDTGPMSLLWLHGHYGTYMRYRTSVAFCADAASLTMAGGCPPVAGPRVRRSRRR